MRSAVLLAVLFALGCGGGLFPDVIYTEGSGRELLAAVAHADRLPPNASDVRAVSTSGPDRIIYGEFSAPQAETQQWFERFDHCDPTVTTMAGEQNSVSVRRLKYLKAGVVPE